MTLTGTVDRIVRNYAFVQVAPKEEYFASKKEFTRPELFQQGQRVKFTPALTHKGPQAFQIEAA